jgi:hypothetical protein
MNLDDLAHRVSSLERQLAAARWRERAALTAAVLIGLVFACKSSKATEEQPPAQPKRIVIGGVTIDERGIEIDGLAAAITVRSGSAGDERSTRITAGAVRVGGAEAKMPKVLIEAHGSLASIEATTPEYRMEMRANPGSAGIAVNKQGDAPHIAELRLTGTDATIHATVDRHAASLLAAAGDKARSEVTSRAGDKAVHMVTEAGKPELRYAK